MSYTDFDFPHTHFYDSDLRELIRKVFELNAEVKNFVSINAIKYADPIQWNITRQYEKNTIVIDPITGTAYLSIQPVPAGVALSREEYWTVVFDLSAFITQGNKNLTDRVESAGIIYSTYALNKDDWVVWNGILYKALDDLPIGTAYSPDYNIEEVTVEEYVVAILDAIDDEKLARESADRSLQGEIDALEDNVGNLNDLSTIDKSSLVAAINEVNNTGGGAIEKIGDLEDLTTTDKSNLVAAINEVNEDLSGVIAHNKIYNVLDYGAKGDGVTDDTNAINQAIADVNTTGGVIYFPRGRYLISDTLLFTHHATTVRGDGQQTTFILQSVTKPAIQMGDGNGLKIAMRVEDIAVSSTSGFTTQSTNTIGIYFNWCVNSTCNNTVVGDMMCGYQLTHTGNSFLTECGYSSNLHNSVGFNIGDNSVSTKVSSCYAGFMTDAVDDGIGLIMNRGDIADVCIEYFDVGNGYTAIEIDGLNSPADLPPADIRLHDIVVDGARKYAIDIKNINSQGNVIIDGGWINPYRSNNTACINLTNANNITITNITMQQLLDDVPSPVGIAGSSSSYLKVENCNFINLYSPISVSGIDYLTFINNSIRLYSGRSSAAYGVAMIGCYHAIIENNELYGAYSSGAVYLDGTGDYSIVKDNIVAGTISDGHTNKIVADNL